MPVPHGSATWTILDEPSDDEFEAADEERSQVGVQGIVFQIIRRAVALLLVVALALYFATPFTNFFGSVTYSWRHPGSGIHAIPLAPPPKTNPKLPA